MKKPTITCSVVVLIVALLMTNSHAIIIRHDRSINDYRVRESRFPAVFYLERQGNRKVCAATLIDPQWALTAAHCATITSLKETLDNGRNFPVAVSRRQRSIDAMVIHPNFQPGSADEVDLALLRFSEPLDFPRPITLNSDLNEAGRTVSLLGWGFFGVGTTGRQFSDGVFRMAQNRVEIARQRLVIRFDDPRKPDQSVLELEGMPSLGDSGGPALLDDDGSASLAGVAVGEVMSESFREETQGNYGSVAVYERVARHVDWIRRTIATRK